MTGTATLRIMTLAIAMLFGFPSTVSAGNCFNMADADAYEVAKQFALREIAQNGIFIPDSVDFPQLEKARVEKASSCLWHIAVTPKARFLEVPSMMRNLVVIVDLLPVFQKEDGAITWHARFIQVLPNR